MGFGVLERGVQKLRVCAHVSVAQTRASLSPSLVAAQQQAAVSLCDRSY
jgi:hypothetical protein